MPSTLDESGCPIYSAFMDNSVPNVAVQCDVKKQCDNISYVKQRIFESDYVIRQYKKKILLDKSGRFETLNNSQDIYGDATFNVAPSSELNNNYDVIPQAVGFTSAEKAELEARLASTEIKIQEMKSHINQLQMLVTEYETQIEALKIENQLQKCNAKEYNNLINDICLFRDIVLGRKNLQNRHKKVLKKYDKYKSSGIENTESSIDELDIFNSSPPAKTVRKASKTKSNQAKGLLCEKSTVNKNTNKSGKLMIQVNGRPDCDSGNEIINEDSGFSSLGINSPDYYPTTSPCSTVNSQKEKKNVDVATSPITVQEEVVEVRDTQKTSSDSTISLKNQEECMNCSLLRAKTYIDKATSPITVQENMFKIISEDKDCSTSEIENDFINLLNGRPQKDKLNGMNEEGPNKLNADKLNETNTVQEENFKSTACSEIDNDFNDVNELVSDCPLSTRLQVQENNANKINGPYSEENLVEIINGDEGCESLASSEIVTPSSLNDKSLKENINNDVNTVQGNLEEILKDNDNVSLCESDISEGYLFGENSCDTLDNRENEKNFSDTATSPITVKETLVEVATSPIPFIDCISNNLSNEISIKNTLTNCANDSVKTNTIGINTIRIKQRAIATSPIKFDIISADQRTSGRLSSEAECLELNSSKKSNESCLDCEVETILRNMRLDCEFLTPMPKTPVKLHNTESTSCYRCRDLEKLQKENENLQSTFQDIAKSMFNMTWLMKNRGVLVNNLNNDSTSLDRSNIRALNDQTEDILSGLNSSLVNKNLPTVVTDIIKLCENAEEENNVNDNDVLDNQIENVSNDICEIVRNEKQPNSGTPVSKLAEICKERNSVGNNQICKKPKENVSNEFHSEVMSQNQSTVNTDCGETFEVEKDQNIEVNIDKNCEMHDDGQNVTKSPTKTAHKVKRPLKLTKLEKWKRKFIPKAKIRAITPPIRKDKKQQQTIKNKISEHTSKLILDNKDAYRKAVKVMAELRDKEKNKTVTKPSTLKHLDRNNECKRELRIVLFKCDDLVLKYTRRANLRNHIIKDTTDIGVRQEMHSVNPSTSPSRTTRSQCKRLSFDLFNSPEKDNKNYMYDTSLHENEDSESSPRRRRKRCASEKLENSPKRLSRGSIIAEFNTNKVTTSNTEVIRSPQKYHKSIVDRRPSSRISCPQNNSRTKDSGCDNSKEIVSYNDLDIFTGTEVPENNEQQKKVRENKGPKDRILCKMLEKYARTSVKFHVTKKPETKINAIAQKLEEGIANIISVPQNEAKQAMNDFVDEIQNCDRKIFVMGLMKYLKEPVRKDELFNKVSAPPAPHMTKAEQVLLYILKRLRTCWAPVNIIETVLRSIEYTLFQLNHTPEFGTVESLSHFYAILCRYFVSKSRLRLFIMDAMYCIQFKSVALIKQCLDVWMHILPLAHMGIAKSPLVMCLIYLLHFFKCEDRYNRVQEIRNILSRKYFYQVTEWTESKMLEMFKNALLEIREIPVEKKMLRMSLIILAKRRGPHWCQKHLIKDMIQPLIEKKGVPGRVKEFCVSVLGPLLKPYPNDMRVHCEVVANQLMEMLDHNAKPSMQEAIFTSLLYMRRHNQSRVHQAVLAWRPQRVTTEMELLLKDYVKEKPAKVWRQILSKIPME